MEDGNSLPAEIEKNLDWIQEYLWNFDARRLDFGSVLLRLSRLRLQAELQSYILAESGDAAGTTKRRGPPEQPSHHNKHFIKFVFAKTVRGDDRPTRLRKLGCSALKFFGLSDTTKDVIELSASRFDFLVEHVADFVERQKL
jgi:hypothetical protein